MHGGMQYDLIQGQGHEPFKVGNLVVFISYLLRHLQWELATDHGFINCSQCLGPIFDIRLVFMSRDFEVGANVSCEESTVSPHTMLIF